MQRERLLGLGQWLDVNGEAIFGTRPWVTAEGRTVESRDQSGPNDVRFTSVSRDGVESLYAILVETPSMLEVELEGLIANEDSEVVLLGRDEPLDWEQWDEALTVMLDEGLPDAPAHVFKITPPPKATESLLNLGTPEIVVPTASPGEGQASKGRLSLENKLKELLDDPGGEAVLEKHLSEMADSPMLGMAMRFTLPQLAKFVPKVLTQEVLDAIAEDLAKL
jgi:hypothetical protein